ncbi:LysM peptidoglycan-binding domain-containing protein [Pseudopelagicola sp. nBUS_19]|uniref:LysM peptidoglycan-binding domain-containing protein n=1 Tax=Pseudopelagicola sp. nBUS_19 TaxID=3395316 RepID=UPI003EB78D45
MAANPLASQMSKEEQKFVVEIQKSVNKALQSRDTQKKADAATNSSTRTAPRPVVAIFDAVLAKEKQRIAKQYAGLRVAMKLTCKMDGPSWKASVTVTVSYPLVKRGGMSYQVKSGDTLWAIAERTYGSGLYWTEIEKANKAAVSSKGNFILAGVPLSLPVIEVVPDKCVQPVIIQKPKPTPKPAAKKARPVATPILKIDLKGKPQVTTIKKPGMTIIVTTTLKGVLKAQKPGAVSVSFNPRTYETEIDNGAKPFKTSFKIKGLSEGSISIASNVTGTTWTSKISFGRTLSPKLTLSPKPVKFTNNGIIYKGSVGLEIEVKVIPDKPKVQPQPIPIGDQVADWLSENSRTLAGAGLIVTAGALVVVTIGEDIVTLGAGIADDPISFAAAAGMARQGLMMIR